MMLCNSETVLDRLKSLMEKGVQIEISPDAFGELLVVHQAVIDWIEDEERVHFGGYDTGGMAASLRIPHQIMYGHKGVEEQVIHLDIGGQCIHIWDSEKVMAALEAEREESEPEGPPF